MIAIGWLILLAGVLATGWVVFIKGRGALKYWVRPYFTEEKWIVGARVMNGSDTDAVSQMLADANAEVRSHDLKSVTAIREWNKADSSCFVGVLIDEKVSENLNAGFVQEHRPGRWVMRVSGANRSEELSRRDAVKERSTSLGLSLADEQVTLLSGQSFALHQWDVKEGNPASGKTWIDRFMEQTAQLRDNLVFTILLTVVSVGLLVTKQPALFAIGVCLMVFLSGACKFVFLHQNTDEADELHLQNY